MSEKSLSVEAIEDRLSGSRQISPAFSVLLTFETGSANLTQDARSALVKVAEAFNRPRLASRRFLVEGHADRRGNPATNQALSEARARAVSAYLVTVGKVDPKRLRAIGKGDREPMNADPAAAENRRVTFLLDAR